MGRRITEATNSVARAQVFNASASPDPRPLSVNIWHRPATLTPSGLGTIFVNDAGGAPSLAMIIRASGTLSMNSVGYASVETAALSTLIGVDLWSMFSLTWEANDEYRLFVNGVMRASGSHARGEGTAGASLIGTLATAAFPSVGDYAEFASWDTALTPQQIASLYVAPESGRLASLVGSPSHYARLLGASSPEPEQIGSSEWVLAGTVAPSTAIATSPAHPRMVTNNYTSASLTVRASKV